MIDFLLNARGNKILGYAATVAKKPKFKNVKMDLMNNRSNEKTKQLFQQKKLLRQVLPRKSKVLTNKNFHKSFRMEPTLFTRL